MRAKAASTNTPDALAGPVVRTFCVAGQVLTAPKPVPGLYLVATPIGNLGDITLRALETLAGVDIIACEDTRITRRLTERYAISALLKPYHEHNAALARPKILEKLAQGAAIALVSDAGTPLISDPGFKLVREVCAAGHPVIALPGPSSVLAALSVAALPTDRFFLEGVLPPKETARRARLLELSRIDATLGMFESGNREQDTRADLAQPAATLETRGEFVLVIGPPAAGAQAMTEDALDDLLRDRLAHDSVKDAVAHAVELSGRPRREIYARALELAKDTKDTKEQINVRGDDAED